MPVGAFGWFWPLKLLVTRLNSAVEIRWRTAANYVVLATLMSACPASPGILSSHVGARPECRFQSGRRALFQPEEQQSRGCGSGFCESHPGTSGLDGGCVDGSRGMARPAVWQSSFVAAQRGCRVDSDQSLNRSPPWRQAKVRWLRRGPVGDGGGVGGGV
jgi:hypothetical protein